MSHEEGTGQPSSKKGPASVEEEFSNLARYIDLYLRQKTDLYIQHYVFEPLDFIIKQVIYLSVLASLLVAGTLFLAIGVVLYVSTLLPLWAALILIGVIAIIIAGIVAYVLFSRKMIMKTPKTMDVIGNDRP
jgi:hypothetical protein